MSIFRRIFVPVDGSAPSTEAVTLAVRLAREWSSDLIFAHVLDTGHLVCPEVPGLDITAILHTAADDGRKLLEVATATAQAAGLNARTDLRDGPIVETLLALAYEENVDLVTIGSHGRSGLKRLMMGSTTEALLRVCRIPVLVVHGPDARKPDTVPIPRALGAAL